MADGSSLQYHVFKDFNIIFDERGSKYGTLRKVQWLTAGKEPDESKARIEIRHMVNSQEGEQFGKGYAFNTEEGPSELTEALIDCGFGNTKSILRKLARRDDFKDSVATINEDDSLDNEDGELFDIRDLMSFSDSLDKEDDNYVS